MHKCLKGSFIHFARGEGKFALQAFQQFTVGAAKLDGTDAALSGGDQHSSQRRVGAGVANGGGNGATAILVGRHPELRGGAFVETTAGAVPGVVHGPGDRIAGLQIALQHPQAARVRVLARRDAQYRFEAALQMKRALAEFLAQPIEGQRLVEMLLDETANRLHPVRLSITVERFGAATKTGAISRLLGLFGLMEELNVFPAGTARRTRRPAIHAPTRHGENELSVAGSLAGYHGIPALVVGYSRFGLRGGHQAFRCEYGIGGHSKKSLRRRLQSGLSESCGQSEICVSHLNLCRICALPPERVQFPEALSLTFEDESNEE